MLKNDTIFASFAVDDADRAYDFYKNKLGLNVEKVMGMGGLLEIRGAGGTHVMVYPKGKEHQAANFTVLNLPVNDIEQTMTDLKAKGVKFEVLNGDPSSSTAPKTDETGLMRDEHMHMSIAWFKDPSGNWMSLIEKD